MFIPNALTSLNLIDSSLKLVTLVLCAIIFWKAFSLYKLYGEKTLQYFTVGFFFFTIGHLFSFIIDLMMYTEMITGAISPVFRIKSLLIILLALRYGSTLIAFISLFYISLGIPSKRIQAAIFILTALSGYLSSFRGLFYHLVVTLFTIFILIDLFSKYKKTKNKFSLRYFMGMLFLYLAYLSYVFFLLFYPFYWIGHGFELLAYITIILALYSVMKKNEAKARKARNHT